MTDDRSDTGCTLCDLPVEGSDVVADGKPFCCVGCRDVYDVLGGVDAVDAEDVRDARASEETTGDDPPRVAIPTTRRPTSRSAGCTV